MKNSNWNKETEIYAKYIRCDDNFVYLNCMVDVENKTIVEKKFPKNIFDVNNLFCENPIIIHIKEGFCEINYSFKIDDTSKVDNAFLVNDNIELSDYSIFNNKEIK